MLRTRNLLCLVGIVLVLCSCGVKKPISLEQRIASGEFAWMDTMQIDTTSRAWIKYYSGTYILDHQNNLHGYKMHGDSITADSLVLTEQGYYYKYKNDSLVDFGRFNVRNRAGFKICVEQYKLDFTKGEVTNEIERIEKEISGEDGAFLMDWYSYTRDYHCFWTTCRHNINSSKQELEIIVDIHNDCLRFQWPGSNQIVWITK
jgi:hypothetical protein